MSADFITVQEKRRTIIRYQPHCDKCTFELCEENTKAAAVQAADHHRRAYHSNEPQEVTQ